MTMHVVIRLTFEGGHGLTHFCDTQEALIKAISMSDGGESAAHLFLTASSSLWDAIEKKKDFVLLVPGLFIKIIHDEEEDVQTHDIMD